MNELDSWARRAALGDADAFELLCGALQQDVWRYCCRILGDRDLAEEAAQDAFMRAVRGIRRFRGDAPIKVWMLVLAKRAAFDMLRRERRHRTVNVDAPDVPVASGVDAVDTHELIQALPLDMRHAFVLTQVLGLPYAEAASITGCAIGTIRSRVYRAREQLVAAMTDDTTSEVCR